MSDMQPRLGEQDLSHPYTSGANGDGDGGNVDGLLFKNLVEMVPLIESFMDKRSSSSFTRRASMVHTSAPQPRKPADFKCKKVVEAIILKPQRVIEENVQVDKNQLLILQERVSELQKRLLEKEEILNSTEILASQVNATCASLGDLKHQIFEKDALINSNNVRLKDIKIKLADKQAAIERIDWEVKMSNKKLEELQEEVVSNELEISTIMQLFEALANRQSFPCPEDAFVEQLPHLDEMQEMELAKMEEARAAYLTAITVAKEDPGEASLAAVAEARIRLQSFIL
ncbi:hypothetical protein HPP92_015550 [Vanilla planifolia]|uniref:Uncharacterized protein n=1 Tax=Vanilla planifolia TaxID=51239 RepID=A0A835UTT7_VANPL|nr:hypothetical protein HPP92_015550 [Vanilla planifolia]